MDADSEPQEPNKPSLSSSKPKMTHEKLIRYLNRHKIKKQPRILPLTYANTQGLRRVRLEPKKTPEIKKPPITESVKARIESDLEFLLANQNKGYRRVRPAESYISIDFDKPKLPVMPKNDEAEYNQREDVENSCVPSTIPSSKSEKNRKLQEVKNKRQDSDIAEAKILTQKWLSSRNNRAKKGEEESFELDHVKPTTKSLKNDNVDKLGKVSLDFDGFSDFSPFMNHEPSQSDTFGNGTLIRDKKYKMKNREKLSYSFSPTSLQQPSKYQSKRVRRDTSPTPISIDDDSSITFDTFQNDVRAGFESDALALSGVSSDFFKGSAKSYVAKEKGWDFDTPKYTEPSSASLSRNESRSRLVAKHNEKDFFMVNQSNKSNNSHISRTKIIKSTISRGDQSPFMEQILLQKTRYRH